MGHLRRGHHILLLGSPRPAMAATTVSVLGGVSTHHMAAASLDSEQRASTSEHSVTILMDVVIARAQMPAALATARGEGSGEEAQGGDCERAASETALWWVA